MTDTLPSPLPRYRVRYPDAFWWMALAPGTAIPLGIACHLVETYLRTGTDLAQSLVITILVITSPGPVIAFDRCNRLRKSAKKLGGQLCPTCHYTLTGASPSGRGPEEPTQHESICPECGLAFDPEDLATTWARFPYLG